MATRSLRFLVRLAATLLVIVSGYTGALSVQAATRTAATRLIHATLILDFIPNAVHAGIYHALKAGYYRRNNIDLTIIQPTSTSDTLKLIAAGKADFGIADGIDVATQIALGRDAQAIMALVQRPLVGLITLQKSKISTAKGFEGTTVGITGVPSDTVAARTIITHDGGDYNRVHVVTIGFNGAQTLIGGKIAAFTGFWPDDGTQVQFDGFPTRYFPLDEHGGPRYPGLVVFSTRSRIAADPALMRDFVSATIHGYEDTLKNPSESLNDLLSLNPTLKRGLTHAVLVAYMPLFQAAAPRYGLINQLDVQSLSTFLVRNRLIAHAFTPARFGANQFLPTR